MTMTGSPETAANLITHRPLGFEAPYSAGPDERIPRHPQENQSVKLGVTTPLDAAPETIYCYWRLNGAAQSPFDLRRVGLAPRQISPFLAVSPLNEAGADAEAPTIHKPGEAGQLCWEASFGPFAYGDRVEYGFSVGPEFNPKYPFSFEVRAWRPLQLVPNGAKRYTLLAEKERQLAELSLEVLAENTIQFKLEPVSAEAKSEKSAGFGSSTAAGGKNTAVIDGNGLLLRDAAGEVVLVSSKPLFEGLLLAQGALQALRLNFSATPTDFYGLGERFDHLNQRGLMPDIQVYEEYKNQGNRTYFPIPFGFSPEGYGIYLDTSAYARFFLPENCPASCEIELAGAELNFYFFTGAPKQILDAYTRLAGRPVLPPDWIYTPWISGNEWNTQARVMEIVDRSEELGIPTGVVVIEAWADETTFYIFNDAQFNPRSPEAAPRLADFTFTPDSHWPDPKAMVDELHRRGIKVLLWQIPVLKSLDEVAQSMAERTAAGQKPQLQALEQHRRDIDYALAHDFVVRNADGTPYTNPGIWFNGAYVLDVTNPAAREWWMQRRAYLVEELGIDGFKTDGGEHLWGRDLRFKDGRRGAELINAYPQIYSQMYFDALQKWRPEQGVVFSRAGFAGSQTAPCHWAGDENSTFEAFRHSIVAGLSAGLSGIPFWGWDIGGFSGPLPSAELYLRAAGMALFCPIMQYHSEYNAHRKPYRDRTPWNVAELNNTPWLVEAYAKLARLRLELLPYIEQEARHSAATGEPLMRALVLDWPNDSNCRQIEDQYMFGSTYLVAPVVKAVAHTRRIYLPEGKWRDYWEGASAPVLEGGRWLENYPAPLLEKPVLVFERC